MTTTTYTVTLTTTNGSTDYTLESEAAARAFAAEEILWENTVRVTCPALSIDERGTFH